MRQRRKKDVKRRRRRQSEPSLQTRHSSPPSLHDPISNVSNSEFSSLSNLCSHEGYVPVSRLKIDEEDRTQEGC